MLVVDELNNPGKTIELNGAADGRVGQRFRSLSEKSSGLVAALGVAVLLGWTLDLPILKGFGPSPRVTMKANTAACFLLTGAALWSLQQGRGARKRRGGNICAAVTTLIGAGTLAQYLVGLDFGIDQLLFLEPPGAPFTSHPGRMAPGTALGFLMMGLALLSLDRRTTGGWRPADNLLLATALIALLGVIGHLLDIHSFAGLGSYTSMAPHTAFGFLLASLSAWAARPGLGPMRLLSGDGLGAARARRLLPVVVLLPLVLGWLRLLGERLGAYDAVFGTGLFVAVMVVALAALTLRDARAVDRAAAGLRQAEKEVRRLNESLEWQVQGRAADLADALAFNRSLLTAAPVGVVTYKLTGECVSCNAAAAAIVGASPAQLERQNFRALESWKQSGMLDLAERSIATRTPQECDVHLVTTFGKEIWCTVRTAVFKAGNEDLLLLILDDVSQRKRAEAQLRQLSRALDQSPVSVLITDLAGNIEYVNPKFSEVTGYAADEVRGKNPRILRSGEVPPEEYRRLWQTICAGREWRGEFHNKKKSGELYWESASVSPVLDEAGRITHFLAVKEDITERKAAEEARQRLTATLDATPDFVAIGDPQGRVLYLNDSGRRLLGLGPEDDISMTRVADGHPEWARRLVLDTGLPAALRDGVWSGESAFLDPSGREIPFSQIILAHKTPEGQVGFISTIARDLSDQRRLEEMLHQSQTLEAVGRLAGGVAHDFNNLLGVITGHGGLMRRQFPEDHPAQRRLDQLLKAAERAAGLTRQLLAFSRKQVMQPRLLDLNLAVRELGKMLERVVGEDVEIEVRAAADLGTVRADPTQVDQVLMNLVVNARDAMPKGGRLTIETANVDFDAAYAAAHPPSLPGRFVMLAVSDDGVGMDAETQEHIFEPFFTTKAPGAGTGLGLATVYGVVKQSGGYVWVYSEPGRGTTFRIYLPRVDEAAGAEAAAPEARATAPSGHETVLVVEDTAELRETIQETLEERGYGVLAAADGEQALALVAGHAGPIELLLTDVVMPKLGGPELALRVAELRPEIRVLYMSGYSDGAVSRQGTLAPGVTLLEKPFSGDTLTRAVREAIDRGPGP